MNGLKKREMIINLAVQYLDTLEQMYQNEMKEKEICGCRNPYFFQKLVVRDMIETNRDGSIYAAVIREAKLPRYSEGEQDLYYHILRRVGA